MSLEIELGGRRCIYRSFIASTLVLSAGLLLMGCSLLVGRDSAKKDKTDGGGGGQDRLDLPNVVVTNEREKQNPPTLLSGERIRVEWYNIGEPVTVHLKSNNQEEITLEPLASGPGWADFFLPTGLETGESSIVARNPDQVQAVFHFYLVRYLLAGRDDRNQVLIVMTGDPQGGTEVMDVPGAHITGLRVDPLFGRWAFIASLEDAQHTVTGLFLPRLLQTNSTGGNSDLSTGAVRPSGHPDSPPTLLLSCREDLNDVDICKYKYGYQADPLEVIQDQQRVNGLEYQMPALMASSTDGSRFAWVGSVLDVDPASLRITDGEPSPTTEQVMDSCPGSVLEIRQPGMPVFLNEPYWMLVPGLWPDLTSGGVFLIDTEYGCMRGFMEFMGTFPRPISRMVLNPSRTKAVGEFERGNPDDSDMLLLYIPPTNPTQWISYTINMMGQFEGRYRAVWLTEDHVLVWTIPLAGSSAAWVFETESLPSIMGRWENVSVGDRVNEAVPDPANAGRIYLATDNGLKLCNMDLENGWTECEILEQGRRFTSLAVQP